MPAAWLLLFAAGTLFLASCHPAEASSPPIKFKSTRDDIASACASLGARASLTTWNFKPDQYGCVDTETGNVVICESDGTCTFYFGPIADLLSRRA
jgi:hypothetical protein